MVAFCPIFAGWLGSRPPLRFPRKFGSSGSITYSLLLSLVLSPLALITAWLSSGSFASSGMAHDPILLLGSFILTISTHKTKQFTLFQILNFGFLKISSIIDNFKLKNYIKLNKKKMHHTWGARVMWLVYTTI